MSGPACKVLFADDEPWVIEGLKSLVDWAALSIELSPPAIDGEDALEKLESERPDILITDINMPFLDGNGLIVRARELYPNLQIIVLSGYSDFGFVHDALLHGAVDYLLKPVAANALLDVVERATRLIGSARDKEREAGDLRAKLLEAASIMRDGEMSAAITDESPQSLRVPGRAQGAGGGTTTDLDLEFASFTLVLAKLAFRSDDARSWRDVERLGGDIKSILASAARGSKSIVFRNLFARGEFLLVSDFGPDRLELALGELPGKLERRTELKASVVASSPYFSFDRLRDAYQEARTFLSCRSLGDKEAGPIPRRVRELHRRITPELENRLAFALESRNKRLAREVIFDEIGLRNCEASGWLVVEARQTAEYVVSMIYHHADLGPEAPLRSRLAMDNLGDVVGIAIEEENVPEACSALEQLLDEAFGELSFPGANDGMIAAARRARDYVDAHYFEDISLTSVAETLGVDRAYLSKAFKQVTGCNFMLAIAKKRIAKAQECIMRGDLSLTDIADLVGYGDYAYFNRVFRKVSGMSPSEFKTSSRGGSS